MLSMTDLKGQRALVTGAGRGIGREIALTFARAGANVDLWARTKTELEKVAAEARELGVKADIHVVDLGDLQAVRAAAEDSLTKGGPIDILVNNAGAGARKTVLDSSPEEFDTVMNVNYKSTYFLTQVIAKAMVARKSGRIINMSSVAALRRRPTSSLYASSKAALNTFTQVLAIELGPSNITVNAIAPSFIRSQLTEELFQDPAKLDPLLKQTPLGRFPELEDVAAMALFLASEAGRNVSGQIIPICGARTA